MPVRDLTAQLADTDRKPSERATAARQLARIGPKAAEALPALRAAIKDSQPEVAYEVVKAIASIEADPSRLVPQLIGYLEDQAAWVRAAAADQLYELDPKALEALPTLWKVAAEDSEQGVAGSAARAILAIETDRGKLDERIRRELKTRGPNRLASLRLLAYRATNPGDKSKFEDAIWSLGKEPGLDYELAQEVVDALLNLEVSPEDLLEWALALDLPKNRVLLATNWRLNASLQASWESGDERARNLVLEALRHTNPNVRESVASLLGYSGTTVAEKDPLRPAILDALRQAVELGEEDYQAFSALITAGGVEEVGAVLKSERLSSKSKAALILSYVPEALDQYWDSERSVVLDLLLAGLGGDEPGLAQQALAVLVPKAEQIGAEREKEVERVAEAFIESASPSPAKGLAKTLLLSVRQSREGQNKQPLLDIIRNTDQSEEARIQGLNQLLADPPPPPRVVGELVKLWAQWIATDQSPALVDAVGYELRSRVDAVLPLADEIRASVQLNPEAHVPGNEAAGLEPKESAIRVRRRAAQLLAHMADQTQYVDRALLKQMKDALDRHAVPVVARILPDEADAETRENLARVLTWLSGREAVDALARAVVGDERLRTQRQQLLSEYYLQPSRQQSEQASNILEKAVVDARRTLQTLRWLNIVLFAVALALLAGGLTLSVLVEGVASRLTGVAAALLGGAGAIVQLVREPLGRIQRAMANLVHIEAAFTSFIWELNLNSTFIQSQYVRHGVLEDGEIDQTVRRIENAMELVMDLVSLYTEGDGLYPIPRINSISPAAARSGEMCTVRGEHLLGRTTGEAKESDRVGIVAIDHSPILVNAAELSWKRHEVTFRLPEGIGKDDKQVVWISLFVGGNETNAVPLSLIR